MPTLYNEARMVEVISAWSQECCSDFGECTAAQLYESFKTWVYRTRAMKRFPGVPVFGMALKAAGYEKFVKRGITYWIGISLRATK